MRYPVTYSRIGGREDDGMRAEFVYFAHIGDYVKVGQSIQPETRVSQLTHPNPWGQVAGPRFTADSMRWFVPCEEPVHSLKCVEVKDGMSGERKAHRALYDFGVAGEWFVAEPALLAWIDALTADAGFPHLSREGGGWSPPMQGLEEARMALMREALEKLSNALEAGMQAPHPST